MIFKYQAKTPEGKTVKGTIEAFSEETAINALRGQNLAILSLKEKKRIVIFGGKIFTGTIGTKEKVIFFRQLSTLISAGLPLVKSLETILAQAKNPVLINIISDLAQRIRAGSEFSVALSYHPKVFDNFCLSLVKTGETSGELDRILNHLADGAEKKHYFKSKVQGALIYPIFVVVAVVLVVVVMMVFVLPKITQIIIEAGVALPITTRIIIATSQFFVKWWRFILLGVILFCILFRLFLRLPFGRQIWHALKLRVPIFGIFFKQSVLLEFATTFAILLKGGVPIVTALKISKETIGNIIYQKLVDQTIVKVEGGESVAAVFLHSKDVPPMFSQMLVVGEETGKISEILERIADFYSREVESFLVRLESILTPLIIVFLGGIVGLVVAAVLMPMYQIARSF